MNRLNLILIFISILIAIQLVSALNVDKLSTLQLNSQTDKCANYTGCDRCTDDSSCVWCDNGKNKSRCVAGNFFGPDSATCDDYYASAGCGITGQDLWIIIGCSGGGLLIIILVFIYCCCCRRRCCRRRHKEYEYIPFVADNYDDQPMSEGAQRRNDLKQKWGI